MLYFTLVFYHLTQDASIKLAASSFQYKKIKLNPKENITLGKNKYLKYSLKCIHERNPLSSPMLQR